jgi:translation initiation factor 4E
MASYFSSNHTTSRFLASNSPAAQPPATQPPPPRVRAPSSKHFSTSIPPPDRAPAALASAGPAGPPPAVHPLRNTYVCLLLLPPPQPCLTPARWVFYFRQQRTPGNKNVNYEEGIKKISAFSSVCPPSSLLCVSLPHISAGGILLVPLDPPCLAVRPPAHH